MTWDRYEAGAVSGEIRIARDVHSPQLNNRRNLLVHLPPSYSHSNRRYPVIYMHDGQNLFDAATSYAGEWHVDDTMLALAAEGREAIIVGIPNSGEQRMHEYTPFTHNVFGAGRGEDYVRFILDTVKPAIDRDFRTLPEARTTGIFGSSMGGLISIYAYFRFSGAFGMLGCMSPSLWVGYADLLDVVTRTAFPGGRIYIDVGGHELGPNRGKRNLRYAASVNRFKNALLGLGYVDDRTLKFVHDVEGTHSEGAWARRLPEALRFLLRGAVDGGDGSNKL
jgi:predicted alpha/beta superfamily hydrolase